MNHCKDCKHKSVTTLRGMHVCGRIPHPDDYTSTKDKAYVQDSEDYRASLRVTEEFGCVLWEAKS